MLVTDRGQTLRTRVSEIRETGRNAQGVRVMNVDADERIVAIEPVGESDDDEPEGLPAGEGVVQTDGVEQTGDGESEETDVEQTDGVEQTGDGESEEGEENSPDESASDSNDDPEDPSEED